MRPLSRSLLSRGALAALAALLIAFLCAGWAPAADPEARLTWAVHIPLAARWLDPGETEAAIAPFLVLYALHDAQIQRILFDRVIFAPIWENALLRASGPRVEEGGLTLIPAYPYSVPYEDLRLKR